MSQFGHGSGSVSRRAFVTTSAMTAAGLLSPASTIGVNASVATPFTLGVASGDPTPNGVVLWTRLAPEPLTGGGMPPVPVLLRWQVAHDERMRHIAQQGLAVAWPGRAHAVHVEVDGLQPNRWYHYRFIVGRHVSPVGRTRTLPRRGDAPGSFEFAFVSCQDWQSGLYSAYRNLARESLDLVIHLGDYIYEYGAFPGGPRQHVGSETISLADYRNRYALYRTDPHLQAAHAACPWLVVPDDHEVENNYANSVAEGGTPPAAFLARRASAYRAYYEHMPLRRRSIPRGPHIDLYRGLTIGDLVRISALDTRQYRSDQPCGDNVQLPCAESLDPAQTMTGPEQERWLFDRLGRSRAQWNVIAQQTMFAPFDFWPWPGELFNMDQWDGYVAARQRIIQFLESAAPSNPIILTGDIHSSWVNDIKADFRAINSPTVATEFVGTSISSIFPSVFIAPIQAALGDNPHTVFFDGRYHGYVRCRVSRERWVSDYRAVASVLDEQSEAFTLASFVVEDGRPGAVPA